MASPTRATKSAINRATQSTAARTTSHSAKSAGECQTRAQTSTPAKPVKGSDHYLDTVVEVGASIDFPSGETLRVTRIEGDTITLEKTP